jgi:hypothetical protein
MYKEGVFCDILKVAKSIFLTIRNLPGTGHHSPSQKTTGKCDPLEHKYTSSLIYMEGKRSGLPQSKGRCRQAKRAPPSAAVEVDIAPVL